MTTQLHLRVELKFETGAITHVGKVREVNEDSYIVLPELGLWAVADGLGGHEGGQFASQTVTTILSSIGPAVSASDQLARFQERVLRANDRIRQVVEERGAGTTIGTTIIAILAYGRQFTCAWSGDSRAYLIRQNVMEQISRDHSEVQELLDDGLLQPDEARKWPGRNIITRAVGIFDDPRLEIRKGDIEPGDVFLMCSDGLTGHLTDPEIASIVSGQRAQDACDALVDLTLERGATDNVTVIIVRCHRAEPTNFTPGAKPGMQEPGINERRINEPDISEPGIVE